MLEKNCNWDINTSSEYDLQFTSNLFFVQYCNDKLKTQTVTSDIDSLEKTFG